MAAFELFLSQGVAATTIEEICERADVANRTFFNHFATRQEMVRALAERRLVNLHDVVFDRSDEPVPARLVGVFDDIAAALVKSGDTYREMIGEMLATSGPSIQGIQRGIQPARHLRRTRQRRCRARRGRSATRRRNLGGHHRWRTLRGNRELDRRRYLFAADQPAQPGCGAGRPVDHGGWPFFPAAHYSDSSNSTIAATESTASLSAASRSAADGADSTA